MYDDWARGSMNRLHPQSPCETHVVARGHSISALQVYWSGLDLGQVVRSPGPVGMLGRVSRCPAEVHMKRLFEVCCF